MARALLASGEEVSPSPPSKLGLMLGSLLAAACFAVLLCLVLDPRWETNDDIAMSMAAHGYGIAATGTSVLIFSNVLWGHLVRSIPEINGILGYSVATLGVLIVVGAAVTYGLRRCGFGYVVSLSALALILTRPILFPQFTINAGLLAVGAIIFWHLYARQNDIRELAVGCLLALCAYLVRSRELLLIVIVALPLLPWRNLLSRRAVQIAVLAFVSAVAVSAVIDHEAYRGAEWKRFNELNPVRALITDFGSGGHLKNRPDILARHGYSINDIDLIQSWFIADRDVANPVALKDMTDALGAVPAPGIAFANAWIGVQALGHPRLLTAVLAALLLAAVSLSWRVGAIWVLFIVAVFALGFLGRPGILRVYVPVVCLLLVAPFLTGQFSRWRRRLATGVLFLAAVVNGSAVLSESKGYEIADAEIRQGLADLPSDPIVVWGAVFPFEAVYPVLGASPSAMSYRLYGLGVFAPAPFSVAFAEEQAGRGLTDRLVSESGLPIIAREESLGLLGVYCRERLRGRLTELSAQQHGQVRLSRRRCETVP